MVIKYSDLDKLQQRSVQEPSNGGTGFNAADYVISMASFADTIPPWGRNQLLRDKALRTFWPTEYWLSSTVASLAARNAAFSYTLDGPKATTKRVQDALAMSDLGNGWISLWLKASADLYCLYGRSSIALGGSRLGQVKAIQAMVRDRDTGPVLTLGPTGEITERCVNQWEKTPLGDRHWVWVSLRLTSQHSGRKRGGLWLTNDHPIYTRHGWLPAGEIRQGMEVATSDPLPNPRQRELLLGSLLGDGGLRRLPKRTILKLMHTEAQWPWLTLKQLALRGFRWVPRTGAGTLHSRATVGLNKWYADWYPEGQKRLPSNLRPSDFTPLALATWYLDDGSICRNKTRNGKVTRASAFLSTQGFNEVENEKLVFLLQEAGIESKMHRVKARDKTYYRIYIGADGAEELFRRIAPYVPPSMRTKLPDNAAPFDPDVWEIGSAEPFFDLVEEVKAKPLKTGPSGIVQTTYHLGVEETRNFIAAGIVVHNTQDNGAFIEVIREGNSPEAPFLGLAHLDSGRCTRTGNLEYPITYEDTKGIQHKLGRWQVIDVVDMPSPIESMNGVGFCAVSRVLRFAQIMRDIAVFQHEKISGRFAGAIHLVSGVQGERIEQAMKDADKRADDEGRQVFMKPPIVATLDPTATIQVATIMLKSLPDNYDPELDRKWFVSVLALAFGCDYQDLAPLPAGGLGSSAQSQILHLKSRGKGPELFQKTVEHRLNFWVLPKNVTFSYKEMDLEAETVKAALDKAKAEARSIDIISGVMTPAVARQIMADKGELEPQYLEMLNQEDVTPEVSVGDESPMEEPEQIDSNITVEDQQAMPPQGKLPQTPFPPVAKVITDDDYGGKPRREAEEQMIEDFALTLREMGEAVLTRVRREMRNEPD